MYKDAKGKRIREGSIVAQAITLNHHVHIKGRYLAMPFTVNVVKKKGHDLVLDGVYCWGLLRLQKQEHLIVIDDTTDMRDVFMYFNELLEKLGVYQWH